MALYSDEMCLLSGPPSAGGVLGKGNRSRIATPRSIYPLTKSQEGMWVEFQTDPSSTKYNLTIEWDLLRHRNGPVPDILDVLKVIRTLTSRHAVLRSMFTMIDGKPHMEELPPDSVDPDVQIVHREKSAISEPAMTQILRKPFDLTQELPARWVVLQDAEAFRIYIVGHHIVTDGQSMTILSREFLEILNNPEVKLPSLPEFSSMHMAERAWARSQTYVENQKVLLSQARNKNNAPWPKNFQGESSSRDSYRKIDSWATFSKSDLDVWSQLFKTSWFRVATALVGLLVVDKTQPQFGKDEVMSVGFGSRPKEMMSCVGQFANALPIKIPLWQAMTKGDGSFKTLVSALGKNISSVKKAELFPAVDVVRSCRNQNIDYEPPRVTVTYAPKLANAECRMFPVEGSWDLFFCFLEYENDVKLGVIYNPSVFSAANLNEMKTQFQRLIPLSRMEGIKLTDMLDWLPDYPSLPKAPTKKRANPMRHVHHWFDAHAESSPDSWALSSAELGRYMTYNELYLSTERKARVLRCHGVENGDRVVISIHRGFAILEWSLAILKVGAAFVFLDPDFTEVQKRDIVSNCSPKVVVDETFAETTAETELVDPEVDIESIKYDTKDDDLVYMIYTSGSTGKPKGVMVEHGNLSAFVKASTEVYECGFGTRTLQLASPSFDASILEWTTALCTGGCLCFAQHPKYLVGDYLADVIEQNEVSFMQITPTAFETLPLTRDLMTLRQVSIGGEAPSHKVFAKWHPRVNLVNAYGPTEAAIAVSFNKIDKSEELPELLTTGPPNPQTDIYICSEGFGRVLSPGYAGEICVAGPQVTRGYRIMPEVTARNFAVHANGLRMYRTGDRGMILNNGELIVTGRIDRELKVRGFRIAPEEVEKAILDTNLGATEVSVQLSDDGLDMTAFVAPDTFSTTALAAALKLNLPSYKIPSSFHAVASLPKNVSGKLDHKATRLMREDLLKAGDSTVFPSSAEESETDVEEVVYSTNGVETVAKIWQDVLGINAVPSFDVNFFDIGGHSLMVPKLHEKLKAAFPGHAVRLVDLFHQSTINKQTTLFGGERMPAERKTKKPTRRTISRRTTKVELVTVDSEHDEETVGSIWQHVLRLPSVPPVDVNFFDIGGHSLLVPNLYEKLKSTFPGKAVRLVDMFHQSTIKKQAALFGGGSGPVSLPKAVQKTTRARRTMTPAAQPSSRASSVSETSSATSVESAGVAITGIAGRFPGAKNVDEFYEMLMKGASGITPSRHCPDKKTLPGNVWVPKAGSLDNIESFDHKFWKLTEEEATDMDPQQRLFMEVAYEAFTDAGVDVNKMDGGRVGLFVGSANPAYHMHTKSVVKDPFLKENRGFVAPSISARTAYHLNISGPNATIQTNCASSTVALSQAFDAIRLGRCDMALVGGVSVQLYEGGYITGNGQIFSTRGECNPFDARADGTVPADAVTAVVLKRYSAAEDDGTPMYARILGTNMGSDGALEKAGYQVPSPRGQAETIKGAWKVSGLSPEKLRYAEIHGSGTPIGDALELEGISLAMKELGFRGKRFTVGSTKGNIGNSQHTSGLVSLIKLCKSMQHGVIPATKGIEKPNQMINPALPIDLAVNQTKLRPSDILAVSAAGWGGVNSHVVLSFPDEQLRKKQTVYIPEKLFCRRILAAPRLDTSATPISPSAEAISVFVRCATDALGVEVRADSNLKQYGLDSRTYTVLASTASKILSGRPVGVMGLMLAECTPAKLAQLYEEQANAADGSTSNAACSSTVVQRGTGVTVVCLPGSEGSCAGAASLLQALPKDVTIITLEHQGENPSSSHIDAYLDAIVPFSVSSKLLLVGVSLGGLSALALLTRFHEIGLSSQERVGLVVLDSPPIGKTFEEQAAWESALSEASTLATAPTYIGAATGQLGTEALVRDQWQTVFPDMEMHELDCGHFDVWGKSHAAETGDIINKVIDGLR